MFSRLQMLERHLPQRVSRILKQDNHPHTVVKLDDRWCCVIFLCWTVNNITANVQSLDLIFRPGFCTVFQIDDLKIKVQDVMGKFKKPVLKKVRMSADAMLKALLGSKHTVNLDLRANLKQVKKEVKEEVRNQVASYMLMIH